LAFYENAFKDGWAFVSDSISITIVFAVAYIVGSTPFGLLVARMVAGIDIRESGSGNIGATNVGRTLGAKWGIAVLLLDAIKGLLPTLLLPMFLYSKETQNAELLGVFAGIGTIVGHMFPFWLRFRGGKGVATSLGVVIVLAPWGSLAALCGFGLCALLTRIVALASIIAALAFGVCQMIILAPDAFDPEHLAISLFSLAIPSLIIIRHRSNIGRLIRGEEKRFSFGNTKKPSDADGSDADATSDPNELPQESTEN
jgi:acyl phosphate:glycerol-3-phosphate acyltransferase